MSFMLCIGPGLDLTLQDDDIGMKACSNAFGQIVIVLFYVACFAVGIAAVIRGPGLVVVLHDSIGEDLLGKELFFLVNVKKLKEKSCGARCIFCYYFVWTLYLLQPLSVNFEIF